MAEITIPIVNIALCRVCHTVISSFSVHDFVTCSCPVDSGIFVDGGFAYWRQGGPPENFIRLMQDPSDSRRLIPMDHEAPPKSS